MTSQTQYNNSVIPNSPEQQRRSRTVFAVFMVILVSTVGTQAQQPLDPATNPLAFADMYASPCGAAADKDRVSFESFCTNDEILRYKGFKIERVYQKHKNTFVFTIKRGRRVLARHSQEADLYARDSTRFGLFSVLGGRERQLIVRQSTGGAHCCFRYWIYELRPRFRLIFDGTKYQLGDGFDPLTFQDMNGDGTYEFTQKIVTFDYFLDCYTCTPQPTMIFAYNGRLHRYLPANHRFRSRALREARADAKELKEMAARPEADQDPSLINYYSFKVLLSYIYAGKEKQGWKLCYQFAYCRDWRHSVKKTLRTDALYRFLYSPSKRHS